MKRTGRTFTKRQLFQMCLQVMHWLDNFGTVSKANAKSLPSPRLKIAGKTPGRGDQRIKSRAADMQISFPITELIIETFSGKKIVQMMYSVSWPALCARDSLSHFS